MSAPPRVKIPSPPENPEALLVWATRHQIGDRLDDVFIGTSGPAGTLLPGRPGELVTYRQVLLSAAPKRNRWSDDYFDVAQEAREFLHRMATLKAQHHLVRAWMDEHGRDPDDDVLIAFMEKLRAELRALTSSPAERLRRAVGTFEPVGVRVTRAPVPMLGYEEVALNDLYASGEADQAICLPLLGWAEGPLRWTRTAHGKPAVGAAAISPDQQQSALEAMLDFIRDPREEPEQEALAELLRVPTWRFALGTLDESLARLEANQGMRPQGSFAGRGRSTMDGDGAETRVAFRVTAHADDRVNLRLNVEPVIQ
ncbi:MAG: hypothetical protein ABIW57_03905, partial [Polyangia bacterium]